jgi:hypothetical protein
LAIIAFSIAAGFGAYYYFTRQNGWRLTVDGWRKKHKYLKWNWFFFL